MGEVGKKRAKEKKKIQISSRPKRGEREEVKMRKMRRN